jgi:hypothetical protein
MADFVSQVPVPGPIVDWEDANQALADGTELVSDVTCPPVGDPPTESELWGGGLPVDLVSRLDVSNPFGTIPSCGYLVLEAGWETTRAALLPSGARLPVYADPQLGNLLRRGGVALAFGHALLRTANGGLAEEFALGDLFGVTYGGLVQFDTEASRVTVTGDSIWAPQYSPPNVIDGQASTFWASIEAGPMPHWVQLDFAKPRTAASAQVSCRPGFLLRDFEVQTKAGEDWQALATVTDNKEWVIDCPFDTPVESAAFRLLVKREEINGENRVIADVGEFTLLDEKGARLIAPPYLIEGRILDEAWAKANRSDRLLLRSPAVRIKPTTAKVLATFPDPLTGEPLPLCTVNRVGKGRAYLFAVPDGAFGDAPEMWEPLLRAFVGEPVIRHSGDEGVMAFLRRGRGRAILHVLDTKPVEGPERAKEVIVRAQTRAFGEIRAVKLLPDQAPLETRVREGWVQFTVPMDPMGTVLLELGR